MAYIRIAAVKNTAVKTIGWLGTDLVAKSIKEVKPQEKRTSIGRKTKALAKRAGKPRPERKTFHYYQQDATRTPPERGEMTKVCSQRRKSWRKKKYAL